MNKFKENDLLIREWNDGDIDFCYYDKPYTDEEFYHKQFFRHIKNLDKFFEIKGDDRTIDVSVPSLKHSWRLASEVEIFNFNLRVKKNN